MPGIFITFEGGEGVGKSTLIARLARRLSQAGTLVCKTRDPGGTPLGEALRRILLETSMSPQSELHLYLACRAELTARVIRPALTEGAVVLCDRYADATVAYQGYGRRLDLEEIHRLNRIVTGGLCPDLTILINLEPTEGLRRLHSDRGGGPSGRALDRLESESPEFHARVREGYMALARQFPERITLLDGSLEAEEVEKLAWRRVEDLLAVRAGEGR